MTTGLRSLELCAGYGGLALAVEHVFGAQSVAVAEWEAAPSRVLAERFPGVPNLHDITTADWSSVGSVDVIAGGTPCQDLSTAGKRAGMRDGTRSGLWSSMLDAVATLRPLFVVWENVKGALSACAHSELEPCPGCVGVGEQHRPVLRAAGRVVGDLSSLGYDTAWCVVAASDVGAPHRRERLFVAAADARRADVQRRADAVGGFPSAGRAASASQRPSEAAADAASDGRAEGRRFPQSYDRSAGGDGAGVAFGVRCQCATAHAERRGCDGRACEPQWDALGRAAAAGGGASGVEWGSYAPAIRRWGRALGRLAPSPTERGPKGGERLSPRFVEWMMGLPDGWVTDIDGLSRSDMLRMLGNGVVPQQAAAALRDLLRVLEVTA